MANVDRNVKYHIFVKLLSLYCCAVVGINVVNYSTASNMGSFKFTKCLLLPACVLFHGLEFVT